MSGRSSFRFRPRFRGLALAAIGLGVLLVAAVLAFRPGAGSAAFALVSGGVGVALGGLYLASPSWSLRVGVDDEALEVTRGDVRRFRLPWGEVERVVVNADRSGGYVDGGAPERSLLVPGRGLPGPYRIEGAPELVAAVLSRVPPDVVEESDPQP